MIDVRKTLNTIFKLAWNAFIEFLSLIGIIIIVVVGAMYYLVTTEKFRLALNKTRFKPFPLFPTDGSDPYIKAIMRHTTKEINKYFGSMWTALWRFNNHEHYDIIYQYDGCEDEKYSWTIRFNPEDGKFFKYKHVRDMRLICDISDPEYINKLVEAIKNTSSLKSKT